MKKSIILGLLLLSISCNNRSEPYVPPGIIPPVIIPPVKADTIKCNERAKEMFDLINLYYKLPNGLYVENSPAQSGDQTYSYLWPYVGLVSGAATLNQIGYTVDIANLSDNYEKYFINGVNGNNIGGYGSSTNGTTGGGIRFYDDNSIVGVSLMEAYNITKEQRFLDRSSLIVTFLKSGVDNLLGGAMWWNEDEKNIPNNGNSNKPACANGYATLFLLEYYLACPQAEKTSVLNFAKSEYAWLKANLQDPADKCYWNDMNSTGAINKTKWAYNTGVMIQNAVRLYRITGDQTYLDDAVGSAQGSYDYFVKPRNYIALTFPVNDPWFNTKLLRAYINLEPLYKNADLYIQVYTDFINNGYAKARTSHGFFYEDWTGTNQNRYYSLLMQDAVVESYGALSMYKKEILKRESK